MTDNRRKIIACVGAMVLVVLITLFIVDYRKLGLYDSPIELNKGWTLIFKGDTTEIESTDKYAMSGKIVKGDSLILRRTLTADLPNNPVLRFSAFHAFLEVYRSEILLYSKGKEDYYKGNIVGSGVHFVYLGAVAQVFQGRTLDLRFHFSENDALNVLPSFVVLPGNYAYGDYYARHSISLTVALFLLLFGVLTLFLSLGALFYGLSFFRILMIGLLTLCLGVWTLCYTKLIQLFSFNYTFNTCLEYITLYISPLAFALLLIHMRYGQTSKKRLWGLITIAALDVIVVIVTSILNFTNTVHYPKTLWVFHAYAGLSLLYLLIAGITTKNRFDAATKILAAGATTFGAFSLLELARFHFMTHFHLNNTPLAITILPIGTLAFVILLGLSYVVYMYYLLTEKTKKDVLSVIAYRDSLTGLYNRAKCQQIFEILDKTTTDFAIVSIDMNGLKHVNDRYGHNKGDNLIKAFASAFHDAFAGVGTSIRMGGDEFVAIVRVEHISDIEKSLDLMKELQKKHSKKLPIPLEAAYGVAYRRELFKGDDLNSEEFVTIKAEKVYQLADERMYDMKSSMKSKLVRH